MIIIWLPNGTSVWDSIKRGIDRAEAEIANEGK